MQSKTDLRVVTLPNETSLENPETLEIRLKTEGDVNQQFQTKKRFRHKKIERQIKNYNMKTYQLLQQRRKEEKEKQQRQQSEKLNQLQKEIKDEREYEKKRKFTIRQQLAAEYRKQIQIKDHKKDQKKNLEQYYSSLQNYQNDKQDEIRVIEISKIIDAGHRLANQRIKTSVGYENSARKQLSKDLNEYIQKQISQHRLREQEQHDKSLKQQQLNLSLSMQQLQQQKKLEQLRIKQQKQRLKDILQKQIRLKNEGKANFPPIVQYITHRFSLAGRQC